MTVPISISSRAVLLFTLLGLFAPAHAQQAGAGPSILAPPPPKNRELTRRPSLPEYPARALMEGREGVTYVLLTADAGGTIQNCAVHRSSGHADLDAVACSVALRRVEIPARYIDGTTRHYIQPVKWKLESPPDPPSVPPDIGEAFSPY